MVGNVGAFAIEPPTLGGDSNGDGCNEGSFEFGKPIGGNAFSAVIGGLVFVRVGRVPARGEIIPHESGAEFEVIDADARRIKRLRVRLPGVGMAGRPKAGSEDSK